MAQKFGPITTQHLDCDVLVIGGGSAGQMAAYHAQKNGAQAVLVDKGGVYRSGCGAAGNDHFLAVLESGPKWDTPEVFLQWYHKLTQGFVNVKIAERSFIKHIKGLIEHFEKIGIPVRLGENNTLIRTKSFMQPGEYFINADGRELKPKMSKEVEASGVKFVKRIVVRDLIIRDGQCIGAVGFHNRTGDFYVFKAKAVVLATGNATRMYKNPSGLEYNTWHSPYNNGSGQAMAFRAGAGLINMEVVNTTLTPKNFSASGLNAIVGMNGYIVNALGERFLSKYHEKAEQGPRWAMPWGVYWETVNGRGPCYFDLRHLPQEDIEHLSSHLLPVDKNTFNDFTEQMGIDISRDLIEIQICEGQHPAFLGAISGINITEKFQTNIPGLMGTGCCVPAIGSLTGSMCCGIAAGEDAAEYVRNIASLPETTAKDLADLTAEIYAPLKVKKGITYTQFEDRLRQVMSEYAAIGRTEAGLLTAERELLKLADCKDKLCAENGHELMRCSEAKDLLDVSKAIVRGALRRKESRFGLSHYRGDYPQSIEEYNKGILQTKKGDHVEISYVEPYELNS